SRAGQAVRSRTGPPGAGGHGARPYRLSPLAAGHGSAYVPDNTADVRSSMTTTSLLDRAGLDKPTVAKIIGRGLEGADDGELFLEYRQSEMLLFDNGRLKQATYDTDQGFALSAGKD